MLTAFTDDSGSENKGPIFVMAGYLSYESVWGGSFSPAWGECLAKDPQLAYFKMKEAHRRQECFRGWSVPERDQRVSEFVGIINRAPVLTAIVVALRWEDFWRAKAEFPRIVDCHPYDMLFHGIMGSVTALLAKRNISESVKFVFDEQGSAGERAILTYRQLRRILPPHQSRLVYGSPELADDRVVFPLQAADLLAWQLRRYVAEQGSLPVVEENGTWRVLVKPGYPILERLASHESLWLLYDYRRIKSIYEMWTRPLSDFSDLGYGSGLSAAGPATS